MDPFVAKHLQGVSRTYAILVPMLPNSLADAVGVAYLLMRIIDTLEDDSRLATEQRLKHFDTVEMALEGEIEAGSALREVIGDTAAERELMVDAPEVFARVRALEPEYREAVCQCARKMSGGVRHLIARSDERDAPYPAIRDAAELREYCYYVAGVVGEMLCAMMAHFLRLPTLARLHEVAVELGIGLQLVNILKDAMKDSKQGRRYLPVADGGNVSHAEIYKAVLQEARQSLRRGTEFVLALPAGARELRSFCGLPIAWGAMTLARAERDPGGAKIGRGAIHSSMEMFARIAGDDRSLRRWLSSILKSSNAEGAGAAGMA